MTDAVRLIGDDVLEIDVSDPAAARGLASMMAQMGVFEEVVPALTVVTAQFDPLRLDVNEALMMAKRALAQPKILKATGEKLTIPVRYGGDAGPDIEQVAQSTGMRVDEFICLHISVDYPVEMIGFTPGFAYLGGLDARVTAGRLARPRARVPAGSVGVIEGYTGIYPLAGPGGWPIIGQTDLSLFDTSKPDPFRLRPGMTVRFEAIS